MARTTPDRKPPAGARRKSRGFQRAGATARPVLDNIAGKHGFAETDVLLNWPHIAGEALSATCQPVKVTYGSSRSLGAVLVVQATSARAPEVEHRAPQIIDRINQFYGYRAIGRIRITQSTGLGLRRGFAEEQAAFDGPGPAARDPSPSETTRAATMAAKIESPGLRRALARMGAHVLAQSRGKTANDHEPDEDTS